MSGLWPLLLFFGGGLGGNCSDGGCRDSFGGMSNILPLLLLFSCGGFGGGRCSCGCSCGENCRCKR